MEQNQELDVQGTLQRLIQAVALLESRIDEIESRVNALGALMQQQAKDMKVILEGYDILIKAVKGHHDLIQSIALALPTRKTPGTLQ